MSLVTNMGLAAKKPSKAQMRKGATRSAGAVSRVSRDRQESRFGNGLLRTLKTSLFVCVLATVGFGFYKTLPYLNPSIKHVVVEGDMVRLDRDSLSQAVHQNLRGGILTLDIEYLRSEISKIAWVEQVEVVKYFPSTLAVRIVEEQAVARWNNQGYISNQGEFIESALYEDLTQLPLLTSSVEGIEPEYGAKQAVEIFHMLNSTVLMYGRNIQELKQSTSGGWSMLWDNGLSIDIGRVDHLNRTRHAMAAWQRLPADVKDNIHRIDARYDNGVAIRARQEVSESQTNSIGNQQSSNRADLNNLARLS